MQSLCECKTESYIFLSLSRYIYTRIYWGSLFIRKVFFFHGYFVVFFWIYLLVYIFLHRVVVLVFFLWVLWNSIFFLSFVFRFLGHLILRLHKTCIYFGFFSSFTFICVFFYSQVIRCVSYYIYYYHWHFLKKFVVSFYFYFPPPPPESASDFDKNKIHFTSMK